MQKDRPGNFPDRSDSLAGVALLLELGGNVLAHNGAEDHGGVEAVAVTGLALLVGADDVTGGPQAGDGFAVGIDDLGLRVDLHAAHGVVQGGFPGAEVPGGNRKVQG